MRLDRKGSWKECVDLILKFKEIASTRKVGSLKMDERREK